MTKTNKPLKVGFDLDGVILYNPARLIRPVIAGYKRLFLRTKKTNFRIPQSRVEKIILTWLHRSSLFVAPGFNEIEHLVKQNKIQAYLITGRYSFLKKDFERWLKKLNAHKIFTAVHLNEKDEQPHLYKERLIRQYGLDVFIDDNWDIINHLVKLRQNQRLPTKAYWVYNLFDKKIDYHLKFPGLRQVMAHLKTKVR